jgi:hypothetical protein
MLVFRFVLFICIIDEFIYHHQRLYSPYKDRGSLTHGTFRNLFRHSVGLLWTTDQPVSKACTYIGQHNTERRGQTSMP